MIYLTSKSIKLTLTCNKLIVVLISGAVNKK